MNAINKISTVLGILSLLACTVAAASAPDISGTYTCTGQDPFSTPPSYTEKLVIKKNGDTYRIQLIGINSVLPYNLGTAVFNKNIDNAFSFVFWNLKDTTNFGPEIFIIKPDGSLDGVFTEHNKNKSGTENCTKSS